MDFDLSEDQRLLQDSLSKLLKDKYGFEQRKAYMKSETGWSREVWAAYAELGLLGMPFAEEDGGLGYGAVETMIVAEQMGRALTLEPFMSTVVMGGGFLRHGATATPSITPSFRNTSSAGIRMNGRFHTLALPSATW